MYARCPWKGALTGRDSSGKPASRHARHARVSRWSDRIERYDDRGAPIEAAFQQPRRLLRVRLPLEAVPNFSDGRDAAVIDAIGAALSAHAELLDVHRDADHNRSVFTLVGEDGALVDALVAGIARAIELIDLRRHVGAHPRIGAADVVPVVPVRRADRERAAAAARRLAERIGTELRLPVFLYADLAPGRGPAFFRAGGPAELQRRIDAGELAPDFGPRRLHPSAGGVIVGARPPLIAFNVNLAGGDVETARAIAETVRERDGGFPGVRALGLELPGAGLAQVSMNVEDWEAADLLEIVRRIEAEARGRGAEVAGSELVGLMPAGAAAAAAGSALRISGFDASRVLELRLLAAGSASGRPLDSREWHGPPPSA
jgi:glutamate formiminotransferase